MEIFNTPRGLGVLGAAVVCRCNPNIYCITSVVLQLEFHGRHNGTSRLQQKKKKKKDSKMNKSHTHQQ